VVDPAFNGQDLTNSFVPTVMLQSYDDAYQNVGTTEDGCSKEIV
jgi:hypothetical protein